MAGDEPAGTAPLAQTPLQAGASPAWPTVTVLVGPGYLARQVTTEVKARHLSASSRPPPGCRCGVGAVPRWHTSSRSRGSAHLRDRFGAHWPKMHPAVVPPLADLPPRGRTSAPRRRACRTLTRGTSMARHWAGKNLSYMCGRGRASRRVALSSQPATVGEAPGIAGGGPVWAGVPDARRARV